MNAARKIFGDATLNSPARHARAAFGTFFTLLHARIKCGVPEISFRARRRGGRETRAFTLAELLIGMTISGLIVGAAFSTYVVSSSGWEKCRLRSQRYQSARVAFDIMERYIQSAVAEGDGMQTTFEGLDGTVGDTETQSDSLTVVGAGGIASTRLTPLGEPRQSADLRQVHFYLDVDEETWIGGLMLRMHRTPALNAERGGEVAELCPNVVAFNITYFDGFDWLDEWYFETGLPEAVQIALLFYDPDSEEGTMQFSRLIGIRTSL